MSESNLADQKSNQQQAERHHRRSHHIGIGATLSKVS
jgi:hypothetical protein